MIGRMLSAGLDTNPIIVDYSYDMPKYLKEQYLGIFVKYTGNDTDEYKNGYTYQVSQKQSGTDTVYFFAPYFYLESLASSADTSKIIDGYQAYNDNGKKIVGRYKTSEKVITKNGTFYPAEDSINAYSKVTVNVAGTDPGVGTGDFWVKVIDYDGTVLLEKRGNNGDSFDLPSAPSHEGLVFQEWSASCPITDGKVVIDNNNIMAGAVYTTASGQNEFDITLTAATGLSVTLNMNGTKDWGDGASDTTMTHTYTAYGDYTIKCNGTIITGTGMFGQDSTKKNFYCTAVRLATIATITSFKDCYSLIAILLSNKATAIKNSAFSRCYSLTNMVIPNSVTEIGSSLFDTCSALTGVVIPNSITSIGSSTFYNCYSLKNITIPNTTGTIGTNAFRYCYCLTNMVIPNGVTSIGNIAFNSCYSLTNVVIPGSVTTIGSSSFQNCNSLINVVISNGVKTIGDRAFNYCCSLMNIIIPGSVTSIGSDMFNDSYSLIKCDFSQCAVVPTLGSNAFGNMAKIYKIIVPDSLYDEWIAAANWSTYADYIYKASEVTA